MSDQNGHEFEDKWPGLNVRHLIMYTDDFIVFLDPELDVDWETSDEFDVESEKDRPAINAALNRAASLECIPNHHQDACVRLNFKRIVGEGLARAFTYDFENSNKIFDNAELYIRNRNVEIARYWQLMTSVIAGLSLILVATLFWTFRLYLIPVWGSTAFYLSLGALAGTAGATLSTIFLTDRYDDSRGSRANKTARQTSS
jgi:hypothetical protein